LSVHSFERDLDEGKKEMKWSKMKSFNGIANDAISEAGLRNFFGIRT
jgi:hypothetical protein